MRTRLLHQILMLKIQQQARFLTSGTFVLVFPCGNSFHLGCFGNLFLIKCALKRGFVVKIASVMSTCSRGQLPRRILRVYLDE